MSVTSGLSDRISSAGFLNKMSKAVKMPKVTLKLVLNVVACFPGANSVSLNRFIFLDLQNNVLVKEIG